jgi:opacity protein-like surface antigen
MRKKRSLLGWTLAALLVVGLPFCATGQDWDDDYEEQDPYRDPPQSSSGVSVRGSFGFTADPEAFAMGLGFPIEITNGVAFTPHLLMAFEDDDTIVAPTVNIEVYFRLSDRRDDFSYRLRPFLQAGIGFAYIDRDAAGDNDDEVGFLVTPGLGLEYEISDNLFIGTNARFNILPKEAGGEHFFFSWEFFSLRIAF